DACGRELSRQTEHQRVHPVVRCEDVRAEPDDDDVEAFCRCEAKRLVELDEGLRLRERTRETPCPDRRQPRERDPLLEPHSPSLSTTDRAIRHGSPTPSVTTTSPACAHAAASSAASSSDGAQPRRTLHGTWSRTSFPSTPGFGASRAPMTSVTIATSASPSASPSSRVRCRVRSYTCGW